MDPPVEEDKPIRQDKCGNIFENLSWIFDELDILNILFITVIGLMLLLNTKNKREIWLGVFLFVIERIIPPQKK